MLGMRQQYLTVKAWRATNPEKYREYQRAYMAKRRGKVAPAAVPAVKPEPVPAPSSINAPAVPVPVVSVPAEVAPVVAGRPLKVNPAMARFLARAKPAPVADDPDEEPAAKPGPPANFARWELESQRRWLKANRPDLLGDELADERVRVWLAGE